MNTLGMARMRTVGRVLNSMDRKASNQLVAALSKRASPVSQWGPDLSRYPDVVRARINSLQTGDLVLTSTRVGSWVGNTVQVLTDSTWNHVAIVVRGHMTDETEADMAPHGDAVHRSNPKRFAKHVDRTPFHFHVDCEPGTPHLFEASGQGVHIYNDLHAQLLNSAAYTEYSTVAVRALQDFSLDEETGKRLEDFIARSRGVEFEADAPLHDLFSEKAANVDSMHCAQHVTATLQALGLISNISLRAPRRRVLMLMDRMAKSNCGMALMDRSRFSRLTRKGCFCHLRSN